MKKREKVILNILSVLLSVFIIIGTSFIINGNFNFIKDYLFLNIICFVLLYLFFYKLCNILFNYLNKYKIKEKKYKNKFIKLFDEKPFLISLIFILVCYLPYIVSFYPTILSKDPSFQIKQYFGIDNKYSYYEDLIDENVIITNHHPVIHTLLLGKSLEIGHNIGNDNLGLFIYSIIQISILTCTLSYTIKYMKKIGINIKYRIISLLIYSLVPVFPLYAMSAVKDVIFGSLIILYIILFNEFMVNKNIPIKQIILSILLLILICLFRNNGIYTIILSFPLLFFINKTNFKKLILIFIIILGFNYSYNNIILPYFKITPGSIREVLSIPFQQTARYVKYNEEDITKEEKEIIDKILKYDTLSERYNPELSDKVKNEFNKSATREDLKEYFQAWFKMFFKHPITYIEATIENTYGYFYPIKTNWYIYYKYTNIINEDGFNYHYNDLNISRSILSIFGLIFPYIPLLGLIVNISFNIWIILFILCYLIYKKKYKKMCYLSIPLSLILVCIASPANAYFRYALPFIFGMPLIISLFCISQVKVYN